MIRGRPRLWRGKRVVMLLVLIGLFFLGNTPTISAQEKAISVTATVEPSKEWKKAITDYSLITFDTPSIQLNRPVKITIRSKGLLEQVLPDQKINVSVYYNHSLYLQTDLLGNTDGYAGLAFVPVRYGTYDIKAENSTYEVPIPLSPLRFRIEESPIFSFLNDIVNNLPKIHLLR